MKTKTKENTLNFDEALVKRIINYIKKNNIPTVIDDAKKDNSFTLLKSSTEYKTVKEKGEIVEEYWKTTLVKYFTDLKKPDCTVKVNYDVSGGCFPINQEENE